MFVGSSPVPRPTLGMRLMLTDVYYYVGSTVVIDATMTHPRQRSFAPMRMVRSFQSFCMSTSGCCVHKHFALSDKVITNTKIITVYRISLTNTMYVTYNGKCYSSSPCWCVPNDSLGSLALVMVQAGTKINSSRDHFQDRTYIFMWKCSYSGEWY